MIATEYNATLGAVGDITLIDPSQYTTVDKGGVQMATSMHVAFDTDEMRFRITYRVDGKPMWAKEERIGRHTRKKPSAAQNLPNALVLLELMARVGKPPVEPARLYPKSDRARMSQMRG